MTNYDARQQVGRRYTATSSQASGARYAANQGAHAPRAGAAPAHTANQTSVPIGDTTGMLGTNQMSQHTASITREALHRGAKGRHRDRDPKPRKSSRVMGAIIVIAAIAVAVFGAYVAYRHFIASGSTTREIVEGQLVTVTIPDGADGTTIAQILYDAGIISNTDDFQQALIKQDAGSSLKSGSYDFVTGTDVTNIVKQLVSGPNSSANRLTIAEGLTIFQTASVVEETLGLSADEFVEAAKASNYVDSYPFLADAASTEYDSLEGYLYPKTYDFGGQDITVDTVIRTMLDQTQTELADYDFSAAEATLAERYGVEMSDYDILKLASIVEKEAVTDDDRPLVASVFYNRLGIGMALQSDCTLTYSLGYSPSAAELKSSDDAYNTYQYTGLTPTPICSPSKESLEATLDPAETSYLYFFITSADNGDIHAFSETYDEHQQVIAAAIAG